MLENIFFKCKHITHTGQTYFSNEGETYSSLSIQILEFKYGQGKMLGIMMILQCTKMRKITHT